MILHWILGMGLALAAPPEAPPYNVLDEAGVLTPTQRYQVERTLVEHERLTREPVLLLLLGPSAQGKSEKDLVAQARSWFLDWGVAVRGRGTGLIALVDVPARRWVLFLGPLTEGSLDPTPIESDLEKVLMPALRAHQPAPAIRTLVADTLHELQSPLITSGEIDTQLPADVFAASATGRPVSEPTHWGMILGALLLIGSGLAVLVMRSHPDAHYTAEGWVSERPWKAWWRWAMALIPRQTQHQNASEEVRVESGSW